MNETAAELSEAGMKCYYCGGNVRNEKSHYRKHVREGITEAGRGQSAGLWCGTEKWQEIQKRYQGLVYERAKEDGLI